MSNTDEPSIEGKDTGIDLLHPRVLWGSAFFIFVFTALVMFLWTTEVRARFAEALQSEQDQLRAQTSAITTYRDTLSVRGTSTTTQ